MSPVVKTVVSAGVLVLCCAAVVSGTVVRDSSDLHLHKLSALADRGTLLASLKNESPETSALDYYEMVSDLLKRLYVDPVTDDNKLTNGAIRGMIASLENPDCLYLDPKQFKVFSNEEQGKFEGVGVDLALLKTTSKGTDAGGVPTPGSEDANTPYSSIIPQLEVAVVVPGSSADKAGIKPGDILDSVDGHWVVNPSDLNTLYVLGGKQLAGKATKEELTRLLEMRRVYRKKLQTSVMPMKARDMIISGTSGVVKATWKRGGNVITTDVAKTTSQEPAVAQEAGGAIAVHFFPGAADKLKRVLPAGPVTIDLRNNDFGDMQEMRSCLALLAPAGTYGEIVDQKSGTPKPLKVTEGSKQREITLLVDHSTRGVAEMFAMALSANAGAKLQGPSMSPDKNVIEVVKLPDGSGYTLVTGVFSANRRAS